MMVLLVSRIPVIERILGQDGLLCAGTGGAAPGRLGLLVARMMLIAARYARSREDRAVARSRH